MDINPKIFKAYDIRGIFGRDFDTEFAYNLGLAYVKLRKKEIKEDKQLKIVVAKDMRLSSDELATSLIKGLTDGGAKVINIGLNSTPTFYFAVAYFNYDGGIIVSASHNPAEWNGFKVVRNKALPMGGETGLDILKDYILNKKLEIANIKGTVETLDDVLETQVQYDLGFADKTNIKPLTVVVDAANSMGATYCQELFKYLPVKLIPINFDLDGTFPNHEADPIKEENMKQLQKAVIAEKADLGIATDGDGDRIFFVDETGKSINQAIIRGVLAKIFLKDRPGSKIAYDIRPGKITEDLIRENGGTPIITKVGHSLIKAQAVKEGAYFAGESSGHFFLNMDIGCFEIPMIVILKLLEEFSQNNTTVSEYVKPYNKYFHSGEINSNVADKNKVLKEISLRYQDGEINHLDGVTVTYKDYWFNVRPSNTEETIRLNLEAVSPEIRDIKTKEVLAIIRNK